MLITPMSKSFCYLDVGAVLFPCFSFYFGSIKRTLRGQSFKTKIRDTDTQCFD